MAPIVNHACRSERIRAASLGGAASTAGVIVMAVVAFAAIVAASVTDIGVMVQILVHGCSCSSAIVGAFARHKGWRQSLVEARR